MSRVSGLSSLGHMTFEKFRADFPGLTIAQSNNLKQALEVVWAYAARGTGWLVITGSYGSGKTHLAASVANERLGRSEPVLFVLVPDLLDHLRSAFSPSSEISYDERFEAVASTPFLILDDFGSHNATPWAQEKLFQLLDRRYTSGLPTVITTNLDLEQIEPRVRSRLMDNEFCETVTLHAPDYRQYRANGVNVGGPTRSNLYLYEDMTFDNFSTDRPGLNNRERENLIRTLRRAMKYAEEPKDFFVLTGDYGCGKTHLAAAIANQINRHDHTVFMVVPDLLDHFRAAFAPDSTISYDRRFEEARRAPILVLDDLGTENATPWAREKLFQIIDFRYVSHLATIITMHSSLKKMDERIRVRIMDSLRGTVVEIIAPSYRMTKPRSQDDDNSQAGSKFGR